MPKEIMGQPLGTPNIRRESLAIQHTHFIHMRRWKFQPPFQLNSQGCHYTELPLVIPQSIFRAVLYYENCSCPVEATVLPENGAEKHKFQSPCWLLFSVSCSVQLIYADGEHLVKQSSLCYILHPLQGPALTTVQIGQKARTIKPKTQKWLYSNIIPLIFSRASKSFSCLHLEDHVFSAEAIHDIQKSQQMCSLNQKLDF